MKRTSLTGVILTLLGPTALTACGDDVAATSETDTEGTSTGDISTTNSTVSMTTMMDTTAGETSTGLDSTSSTTSEEDSSSSGTLPPPEPADFVVTIENVSNSGLMFSPVSPGVWVNHQPSADTLFTNMEPDDGEGLEALAEDGDPTALAMAVAKHSDIDQVGVFDTPVGAGMPGPLLPGDMYEFTFTAQPGTRLGLATMLVGSNDLVIASGRAGVSLFAGGGQVMGERDISDILRVWDAGTELNQAPGQGPMQALHGGSPDMGPPEVDAGVLPYNYSTRAIPLGLDMIDVVIDQDMEDLTVFHVAITNTSGARGTLVTPFSSLVWALHDDTVGLFGAGMPASAELEALAEDGDAAPYDAMLTGLAGVGSHAVIPGPILPGDTVMFDIVPDAATPRFSLATMVVQSNDAFLAMGPEGLAMYDEGMALRSDNDMTETIAANLTAWDAGTEANEVPGVGLNQVLRQMAPNTGPADMNTDVRRYADVTNDLAGPSAGGFVQVEVAEMGGDYTITLTNVSDTTAFPGVFTPTVWATHDDTVSLFQIGMPASPGLETMAEDGDPSGVLGDLMGMAGVGMAGVANIPTGGMMPGPLLPGDSYEFTVTPDATNRFLSFAGMIVPSNDTFGALDPAGVALIDAMGATRSAAAVEADIAAAFSAWDAGTEGNQAGAAGADMAPVGMPNSGPGTGLGLVIQGDEDEIWSIPSAAGIVRVIIAPVP